MYSLSLGTDRIMRLGYTIISQLCFKKDFNVSFSRHLEACLF